MFQTTANAAAIQLSYSLLVFHCSYWILDSLLEEIEIPVV